LKFTVIDSGAGIPKEKMARLFKRFSQIDDSLSRHHGGTGLGLVISKGLINAMGGEIGVESEPNRGSTFWFTITMHQGVLDPNEQQRKDLSIKKISALNILLIDDDAINRLAGKRLLEMEGHHVELANNGLHAIEVMQTRDFDLLLMDVHMPELDGIETTKQIRATFEGSKASVPIIAVTASVMEDEKNRYLDAGMNSVVAKPLDIDDLNWNINKLCGSDIEAVERN
ncbi:MAG: response regulator, partial [Gammaproteobacteria bacterium]|nr:response regulator [Gammaproteobacteria bacterium]